VTLWEELEAMEKRSGRQLLPDEPLFPAVVEYLWEWFQQLHATRGGGFGPASITYAEIDAWSRQTGTRPTPWEVEQLKGIDREWLTWQAQKMDEERGNGS